MYSKVRKLIRAMKLLAVLKPKWKWVYLLVHLLCVFLCTASQ